MMNRILGALFSLLTGIASLANAAATDTPIHHDLQITLQPERQYLSVTDQITLPGPVEKDLILTLHAGLQPVASDGQNPIPLKRIKTNSYLERYRLRLPPDTRQFTLSYQGQLHHALESSVKEQARGFRNTAGLIDEQGSFLSGSSLWYPQFEDFPYLTFDLQVSLPQTWRSVSQGKRITRNEGAPSQERWREDQPQQEIYLIAAEFTEYSQQVAHAGREYLAQVFLREEDAKLADSYLEATARYLKMYDKLLGPYPYSKFALVENFWETGFGMPSFTLLGSKVIRLPFIINSSYPHEILHNWWGNGVYVDYASGNWSEGLTAYLADHLIKQQQGQDAAYRQQALQKYRDYAAKNRDFPLSDFRGRHSSASEAVGYGKSLMLFHMLRQKIGDQAFTRGLQQFYRDHLFKVASYADLEKVFSAQSGTSLRDFFSQWVTRTGAPELVLQQVNVKPKADQYQIEFTLQQLQRGAAYQLDVPIAVSLKNQAEAQQRLVSMQSKQQRFVLEVDAEPLRIDVDPGFDLFRKLAVAETPAAFTQLFGSSDLLIILPRQAPTALKAAWQDFARDMANMGPERVSAVWDDEITKLPKDQALAVLGWENRFGEQMQRELKAQGMKITSREVQTGLTKTPVKDHAFAWVTRIGLPESKSGETVPRAWITADLAAALPGLGRKLPHYHKYSYLAFQGEEPQNQLKGRWSVTDSPMTAMLQTNSPRAKLKPTSALIEAESVFSQNHMMQDIRYLSSPQMQGRGFGQPDLDQAAEYIAQAMQKAGLQPAGDEGSYFQHFSAQGGENNQQAQLKNVVGVIPGSHPELAKQNLVIGAHYDHLGLGWPDVRSDAKGKVHHGADDNASGVAVLLELARILGKGFQPDRSIVFVAFSGEEAGRLGSSFYTQKMQAYPIKQTIGMLNLDTVGRLFDNQLMVLGAESATEWPHIFRGIGFVTGIPSVMVSEPLDASDQVSFHEAGVPAVQLFSGPHSDYHRPGDTADKIDADGLVKVAEVSKQVIEYLSSRPEPMTNRLAGQGQADANKQRRTVSLGSIPDFTFQGEGYRLDGVMPSSPAEQAGLRKLDIIKQIDQTPIKGLRDVSSVLKTLKAGETITIHYLRDDQMQQTQATLLQR